MIHENWINAGLTINMQVHMQVHGTNVAVKERDLALFVFRFLSFAFDRKLVRTAAANSTEYSGHRLTGRDTVPLREYHLDRVASPVALIPH